MGSVAFPVLMLLEIGFSVLLFGETLDRYDAKYASAPGVIGLATQVCFAALPCIRGQFAFRGPLQIDRDTGIV